eukprot:TRINITY_DN1643_c1_g1_i10.p1 TRINITY_DN1643_c1_g1~~TRINITY_DN1643_c1_g1_i10.p1  ORF type:complete len:459 (+),score=107.03 TRINITY_DN1643_c1_g1_i10:54-1379(+)
MAPSAKVQIFIVCAVLVYVEVRRLSTNSQVVEVREEKDKQLVAQDTAQMASVKEYAVRWYVGVCGRTEGDDAWLREWIELQKMAGVDHVWLIDGNVERATDVSKQILRHYSEQGFVTVIPMQKYADSLLNGTTLYNKICFDYASTRVKWLIISNTDRLFYTHNGCSLAHHLRSFCHKAISHIAVQSEAFGDSGHNTHPHGLITENYLSSTEGSCPCPKFGPCPCKRTELVYNTECVGSEHGERLATARNLGDVPPLKNDLCFFRSTQEQGAQCTAWAEEQGFLNDFSPKCCAAGIGVNDYSTISPHTIGVTPRVDSNNMVSYSLLKYLLKLKMRMRGMGISTSENTNFIESPRGTCYVEDNRRYVARKDAYVESVISGSILSIEGCCEHCQQNATCRGFAYSETVCRLLHHNGQVPRHHIQAFRKVRVLYRSGVPLRDQCA